MKILAIIVTYNSEKWIDKNINSIIQHGFTGDVLVIDNGSQDTTLELVRNKFPKVRVIESDENLGFARANNLGFEIAKKELYDYVFLVNHDGWLLPGFWSQVLPILSSTQYHEYGLLSPVHLDATEKKLDYGFEKYVKGGLREKSKDVVETDLLNGAFLFISHKCLTTVKGFDPAFFFYGEDIDLCHRAKRKGYKLGVISNAKVVHDRQEREMTKDRLKHHLYANALIQIKSDEGAFVKSFAKAILSNVYLLFIKNTLFGYIPELYVQNLVRLIMNSNQIKNSYNNYK